MRLEEKKNLLLSDTLIPDLFISEYMVGLSACAIQSYMYLLMAFKNQKSVSEKDLAARFSVPLDEVKGALAELALAGVIEWSDKGSLILTDLKSIEIDGYIRLRSDAISAPEAAAISPENERRDNLAKSIEKTFFHGSMAYKWYRETDMLLDDFGFEPQVVYKLFQVCSDRKQLGTVTQMKELAIIWQSKGIRTLDQLSAYMGSEDVISQTMRKIGRRLHRKMTDFDEEYIRVWIEKLQFPYDMIDFAIRKMCEYQQPTMNKADAHLKAWFSTGITTLSGAQKFEEDAAIRNRLAYQRDRAPQQGMQPASKQNFQGVEYDEAFIRDLEVDPEEYLQKLRMDKEGDA
jgi:DNA replication protein DnaD